MLDQDFGPLLDKILRILPARKTMLFSATLSSKVESLQRASLSNPQRVSVSSKYQTVSTLQSYFLLKPHKWKDLYLVYLLNEFVGQSVILFCRTIHEAQRIGFLLRSLGFGAIPLHGQLSQSSRLGALGKFRSKSRDILVWYVRIQISLCLLPKLTKEIVPMLQPVVSTFPPSTLF